jgi:hypothetical protein
LNKRIFAPAAIAALVAIAALAIVHCAVSGDTVLAGKSCPCAEDLGYVCDCSNETCVKSTCEAGFGVFAGRCVDFSSDPSSCGACGHACSGANSVMGCVDGGCVALACAVARDEPIYYTDCEGDAGACTTVALDHGNCGSCGNDCRAQFTREGACSKDLPAPRCECGLDEDCNGGRCADGGTCVCGGTACSYGEACAGAGCSCNGGPACNAAAGEICCVNPAGCVDPRNDPNNCGACGVQCPPDFKCAPLAVVGPGPRVACGCQGDDSCNAGDPGARCDMATGLCICGMPGDAQGDCSFYGQRCLVTVQREPYCG